MRVHLTSGLPFVCTLIHTLDHVCVCVHCRRRKIRPGYYILYIYIHAYVYGAKSIHTRARARTHTHTHEDGQGIGYNGCLAWPSRPLQVTQSLRASVPHGVSRAIAAPHSLNGERELGGKGKGHVVCDSDGVRSTRRPRPPDGASRPSHTTSSPPRPLPVMPGLSLWSYWASVLRSLPVDDHFLRPPPSTHPHPLPSSPASAHTRRHGRGCLEGVGRGDQWVTEGGRGGYRSTSLHSYTQYTCYVHTSGRQEGKSLLSQAMIREKRTGCPREKRTGIREKS